jgi:hypothetical protein
MIRLPDADNVVIPVEKFTKYALSVEGDIDKTIAFGLALGYNKENASKLIDNIRRNLNNFEALPKGDKGYGMLYEVSMELVGENGKSAKVTTGWIDDKARGEVRLVTAYIDEKKEKK